MRQVVTLAALTVLLLAVGCGDSTKPKTVPVKGKVLDAKGNPMTTGSVRFDPKPAGDVTITADVSSDGSYSLKTFRNRDQADGAPPGDYEVTIIRPIVDGNNPPPPVKLPGVVTVPTAGSTDLTLKMPAGVR